MAKNCLVAVYLAVTAIGGLAHAQDGAGPVRFVVSAGVTSYSDFDIPGRTEGETYSYLVAERFVNPSLGGVAMERAGALYGSNATLGNLTMALDVCATSAPEDEVFVYLCLTMAVTPRADGTPEVRILPYTAKTSDLSGTSLTVSELAERMAAIPARKKYLFLDASPWSPFRPEGTPEDLVAPEDALAPLAEACTLISAVSPGQPLTEESLKRPLLGFCLVTATQGLGEGEGGGDGVITMAELGEFIRATAGRIGRGDEGAQRPAVLGGELDDTVFMRSVAPDPECPAGMRLVGGRVCVDIYEAPNVVGAMPVTDVNQFAASGWCREKGKRLCEPDEWEDACRGPEGFRFPYGDRPAMGMCNIGLTNDPNAEPERIGSRPGCVSGYGIYDMIGNVSEYIGSGWGSPKSTVDIRGASLRDQRIDRFDCTTGGPQHPVLKANYVGFRCCADPR